jgi:hypothetical protein
MANRSLLGFRRGTALLRTQSAVIAFLVNGLAILIGLAGFELHGFPADAADWESWFRGDRGIRDVGQESAPSANHQIAQEADAQEHGGGTMW